MVHIYNGILLSHKKNKIMPFAATWMQLEIIIQSEINQKEKDKYHMIAIICGISNMTQMNLSMKQKERTEDRHRGQEEGVGEGMEWEVGVCRCKLLYIEWINKLIAHGTVFNIL